MSGGARGSRRQRGAMGVGVYGERRGHTLQSVIRLGQPTPIVLLRRKPSLSRYESRSVPPSFLMIWMRSRLSDEVSAPFVDAFAPAGRIRAAAKCRLAVVGGKVAQEHDEGLACRVPRRKRGEWA